MVVVFTMKNDQANVACAISTDAMDALEGSSRTPPAQREQQFLRLRDRIEERAARKFSDVELEGNPPGVILRAIDFSRGAEVTGPAARKRPRSAQLSVSSPVGIGTFSGESFRPAASATVSTSAAKSFSR